MHNDDDDLLTPREVAAMLGVRTGTIARWARLGMLKPAAWTPGGHRRYRRRDVRALREIPADPAQRRMAEDAVRLYRQGRTIRQVAAQFGCGSGRMRRILLQHTTLGARGGKPGEDGV